MHAKLLQSSLTLCDPVNYSLPGPSVHWILQARVLEWVAIAILQGVFLTQGSNPCFSLLHWHHLLYWNGQKKFIWVYHNIWWKKNELFGQPDRYKKEKTFLFFCFPVMRPLKIYSLKKFRTHHGAVLSIAIKLYITSLVLCNPKTGSWYLSTAFIHFFLPFFFLGNNHYFSKALRPQGPRMV